MGFHGYLDPWRLVPMGMIDPMVKLGTLGMWFVMLTDVS